MTNLVDITRMHTGRTANGAVTHETSLNSCLDYFQIAGTMRNMSQADIVQTFERAYAENPKTALQILLWARDCRGGSGERHGFRIIGNFLKQVRPDLWDEIAIHTPDFGSWKDIFAIEVTPTKNCIDWLCKQLEESPNANLLAKWYPRKGAWFTAMHKYKSMTPKEFRKYLVEKTNVVEQKMCAKEWDLIDYKTVPSNAMNKYGNTFFKNDGDRFVQYIDDVNAGKTKINASVLYPHELYQAFYKSFKYRRDPSFDKEFKAIDAQWNALPNYMEGNSDRILPVCDTSGSMTGLPMDVSVALGCYISERNVGLFKDAFITFSERPEMQYLNGKSPCSRFIQLRNSHWGMNTNLQAVFSLVLDKAKKHRLSPDKMPTKILIISDMEFDEAVNGQTNLEAIREQYTASNYDMPELIFWNVNGRVGNSPALKDDGGVGLVSGFSPSILTSVLSGKVETPEQLMLKTVDIPRYQINWDYLVGQGY